MVKNAPASNLFYRKPGSILLGFYVQWAITNSLILTRFFNSENQLNWVLTFNQGRGAGSRGNDNMKHREVPLKRWFGKMHTSKISYCVWSVSSADFPEPGRSTIAIISA